jgi:hypothetical protein
LAVGGVQLLAERVVGCAVLCLAHDVVLASGEIGESALEALSVGLSLPGLAVVHAREIRPRVALAAVGRRRGRRRKTETVSRIESSRM